MNNININVVIILAAFALAMIAIAILYAIINPRTDGFEKDKNFQLTTKNILEHVKTLYDKGEFALVQLLAVKYLERMPAHLEVRQYLAKAFYKDKKFNNSIKQCLIILKKNPNDTETLKTLGDCYINKELLMKAIQTYEALYELKSNDKDILEILGKLYNRTEQYYSAIAAYKALAGITTQNDKNAEIQSILADLSERTHNYPDAFEAYKNRLNIYPNDVDTNKKLASLYMQIKNQQKALEVLLYMLSFLTEPKDLLWTYENLINIYTELEEYENAINYSERLLDVQGSDKFKVRNDIAQFNIKLERYESGIHILEDLVMMSQSAYDVTISLAQAYIVMKRFQDSLDKYMVLLDKATQQEAKNIRLLVCELYIEWAKHEAMEGNFNESFKLLDTACDYNAINPEVYYNKALNHFAQKSYAACVEFIHKALEFDKFNTYHTKYYLKLAEAHHNLNHFFEEKKALSDLLKIDSKNAMGLYRSGLMYISQHDTKNAEDYFLKALQSDPELIPAKYNLALLYETNNPERARELYTEILESEPDNAEAKSALFDLSSSSTF